MANFDQIIALSKKIKASLWKGESPTDLEKSELFDKKDKEYILKKITDKSKIEERFKRIDEKEDWETILSKIQHSSKTSKLSDKRDKEYILKKITDKSKIEERYKHIDEKEGWDTILSKIQYSSKTSVYWIWGAAASIVVLISISYFFLVKEPQGNNPTLVDTEIKIGTDKATLTLEDGTDITLKKGTTYQTENVNSNGEQLVYGTTGNGASPELAYNYLTVPRGGQFFVQLSDSTKVWLNSESKLKYPVKFIDGETRKVELVYGEAYFDVSPSRRHDGARFKVHTKGQHVEVLGTEFNIKAYKGEDNVYTTLVEGKVAVSNTVITQMLTPEQQSNLDLKTNDITIVTVDTYNETLWKEGRFRFNNKPLKEIMTVLGRWYDVDVVFAQEELKNVEFTGVLNKNQNIKNILKIIENTNYINAYEIKDKIITIK